MYLEVLLKKQQQQSHKDVLWIMKMEVFLFVN